MCCKQVFTYVAAKLLQALLPLSGVQDKMLGFWPIRIQCLMQLGNTWNYSRYANVSSRSSSVRVWLWRTSTPQATKTTIIFHHFYPCWCLHVKAVTLIFLGRNLSSLSLSCFLYKPLDCCRRTKMLLKSLDLFIIFFTAAPWPWEVSSELKEISLQPFSIKTDIFYKLPQSPF